MITAKTQGLPCGPRRSALKIAAYVVLAIAVLMQLLGITQYWWDPPLCDQRLEFQHYVDCINGRFHREIVGAIEVAAGTWVFAGITGLLGRFIPPLVSAWLPAVLVGTTVLLANDYWDHEAVDLAAVGRLGPDNYTLAYWKLVIPWVAFWCTPAIGAWMTGFYVRISRRSGSGGSAVARSASRRG